MKIRMLCDNRVFFRKGEVVEVEEGEARRLLSLGFASEEKEPVKVEVEEAEEPKAAPEKKPKKKK